MSDPTGNNQTPSEPEAELLGPERTQKAEARRSKEPPVIEGEADEVTGGSTSAASASKDTPSRSRGSASGLGVGIAAGVAGALVVALVGYSLGFGPADRTGKQVLADLDARIASVETKDAESATRLAAAEEKIAAATQSADGVAATGVRLDKIEADAAALKQSLAEAAAATQASQQKLDELAANMPPAGIADQLTRLEAMVRALNTAVDALAPRIDQMDARVAALEAKKDDPDAAARATLGLALANLSRAATSAGPFDTELGAMASFLPNEPELAALKDAAARGVPTEASLKDRFPALVQTVLDAERQATDSGLFQRFIANARMLITVRRTGEITGEDTQAVLARMEERLKANDLAAAVKEAHGLKGAAADAAAPWVKDAEARVATTQLLRDLTARVSARLAAGGKG